jgi:hypothetical protein
MYLHLLIMSMLLCFTSKLNPIFTYLLCVRKRSGVFPVPAPRPIEALKTHNPGRACVQPPALFVQRGGLGDAALPKLQNTKLHSHLHTF